MATPAARAGDRPRTLSEWLRQRPDPALVALLRRRPDLALPTPGDLATLARRVEVRTSVQRAVDALDAFTLAVLDGAVLAVGVDAPVTLDDLRPLLAPVDDADLTRAVDDLLELALLWGDPGELRLVPTVREALGTYPAGLGRPATMLLRQVNDVALAPVLRTLGLPPAPQPRAAGAIAAVLGDPQQLAALLEALDDDERDVLQRLAAGPPVGVFRSREGDGPVRALLSRGLVVPIDVHTVELPREVGLALRERPVGDAGAQPPRIRVVDRSPGELDRFGTTAVLEAVRLVESLGDAWTAHPPAQLRSGGLGVRELRRTATVLGLDESAAAVIVEVAAAAGLVNATHGLEPVYLPTAEFDTWRRHGTAERWADLAQAWLAMTRQPSLVGQRGDRDRLITALSPDVERGTLPALRRSVLDTLTELPPGSSPTARAEVLDRLRWQAPRRAAGQRPLVEALLTEADLLGVTAAGGLTGYSRTLLAGTRTVAEQVLDSALPAPVDSVLVQPDLTIVVPGPPTPDLAADLALAADLESTGGASVYRMTEASIRRALDAGRSGTDIAAMIAQRSRTPVPQSLTYLIDDLARRHGTLRTGSASSYLRCDDEALLARVVSDRGTSALQLRRIAPTVVISTAPAAKVLDVLRAAGYAPAAENADGDVVMLGAEPQRAPSRQPVRVVRPRAGVTDPGQLADLVKRVRAGEAMSEMVRSTPQLPQPVPGVTSAAIMGTLREAIRNGRRVLLGVAEADGTAARHTISPISLGGGFVRGQQSGRSGLVAFPLHRVTAVRLIDDDPDAG